MELRHLRYFLAVAEELHFGRAAKRVHISQPPLSQQIRQLEEELRVKLFYRTRKKVELTDAGRVLAGEARLILQQVDHALGLASEANRGKVSQLVIGCSPANCHVVLDVLRVFSARHPNVQLLLKSLVTQQQMEAIRNGRIDLGFLTLPLEGDGLAVETILRERLVVALPKNHPLAARKRVSLRSLANDTQIIFPLQLSQGRYDVIARLCRNAGFSLHTVHEVDNTYTMLELINAGMGVSLMRASVQKIRPKGVVFRELLHSPEVETGIAYRRENHSKLLPLFLQTAREVIAS